jgi:hypothetical protein
MDMDSSGNAVVGGTTSSTDLVDDNALPNAYIVYFNTLGNIAWNKQYDTSYT